MDCNPLTELIRRIRENVLSPIITSGEEKTKREANERAANHSVLGFEIVSYGIVRCQDDWG